MDHGISLLPDCRPGERSAEEYFSDMVRLATLADQGEMRYVKMTEHYLQPYGGYCPSPLTFLAAVAARTEHLRLLTGGILAAFHHPVQIAAHAAMVDAISRGRLEVGFARAYMPYEFAAFGVPLDESRARFEATIEAVLRLWTEPEVTESTPFFAYERATSLPRPTQAPHPPVWGSAVRSGQSFAWLAERGFRLMMSPGVSPLDSAADHLGIYRESFVPSAVTARSYAAASLPLFVADTDEEAARIAEPRLREYLDVWSDAGDSWRSVTSADYAGYTGLGSFLRATTTDDLRRNGGAIHGSPDHVADQIAELRATLNVDCLLWQVDFGGMPGSLAERSLELYLDKVWPQVCDL